MNVILSPGKRCEENRALGNHSSHGVAGEACTRTKLSHDALIPDTRNSWLEGILRIPLSNPSRQPQEEGQTTNEKSREMNVGNVASGVKCNDKDLSSAKEANISPHEDEMEKIRLELACQRRINLELKRQLSAEDGLAVHERVEEIIQELTMEQTEKFAVMRQLTDLSLHVEALNELLQQERFLTDNQVDVDKELVSLTRELTNTKQELRQTKRTVVRLEKEQDMIGSLYERKFAEVHAAMNNERIDLLKKISDLQKERTVLGEQLQTLENQERNSGEWQRQLFQKEDFIIQLKSQVVKLERDLQDALQNLESASATARSQELYRADEALDLRVLNDSQENEILTLNQNLKEAKHELTARDQRIEELQRQVDQSARIISEIERDGACSNSETLILESDRTLGKLIACKEQVLCSFQKLEDREKMEVEVRLKQISDLESKVKESSIIIVNLETKVEESCATINSLQHDILENQGKHDSRVNELVFTMDRLSEERESLKKQVQDVTTERDELKELLSSNTKIFADETSSTQMQQLQEALEDLEKKHNKLERSLLEAKLNLAAAEEHKTQLQEEYDRKASRQGREEKKSENMYERAQRIRVQRMLDPSIDATKESPRITMLLAEIDDLKDVIRKLEHNNQNKSSNHEQTPGSLEQDLRKELEKSKNMLDEKEAEKHELLRKLQDHESVVASLTESALSYDEWLKTSLTDLELLRSQLGNKENKDVLTPSVLQSASADKAQNHLHSSVSIPPLQEKVAKEIDRLRHELLQTQNSLPCCVRPKSGKHSPEYDDDEAGISTGTSPQLQLKERDKAISKLVKQSMRQTKAVDKLRFELEAASRKIDQLTLDLSNAPSWEEVTQLRQEAEVFAGQVIEQDEEIEALRNTLSTHQQKLAVLEQQLSETAGAMSSNADDVIRDLKAEVDELREANREQIEELRLLRKKDWEVESNAKAITKANCEAQEAKLNLAELKIKVDELSRENAKLLSKLDDSHRRIMDIELRHKKEIEEMKLSSSDTTRNLVEELKNSQQVIEDLKASPCYIDEIELESLHLEIKNLQSSLNKKAQELDSAQATIRELDGMLAEKRAQEAAVYEEEKEELLAEIESLNHDLEELRTHVKQFEQDRELIVDFKAKLERADDAREESEKAIVANYERKMSLLVLDKDVTIDNLRKQLFEEKEANAGELEDMVDQLKNYQLQVSDLTEKLDSQVKERDTRIYALERTLAAQEQLINNMKTEMDHLQASMETSAARRRHEIDDMQQELLSLSSANTKLDREVKVLQLELAAKDMAHKADVEKLTEIIAKYDSLNPAEHRTAADLQMEIRVKEVKDRLEKLKWRNTSLKEENENLRERLELAELQAKEIKRQNAQCEELRALLSEKSEQVRILESELEQAMRISEEVREKYKSELERATVANTNNLESDSNRPPRPHVVRSRSESKDDTRSITFGSPSIVGKNSDKKQSSPLRLSFLRKKTNNANDSET